MQEYEKICYFIDRNPSFFTRIMKEHAFFLLASFLGKETDLRKRMDWFREKFEFGFKISTEDVKTTEGR